MNGGGTESAPVGLSGSQVPGVNYLLIKDGSVSGSAVNGTGGGISFGNQTVGLYGVRAHRIGTYMYRDMNGTVTVYPALLVVPTATPSTLCAGGSTQLSAGASGGSGSYTYSWSSNPAGFTSALANPTVTPAVNTTYTVVVNDGYTI